MHPQIHSLRLSWLSIRSQQFFRFRVHSSWQRTNRRRTTKPACLLIAKDMPPLQAKLVEKAQQLKFVEMEEFLLNASSALYGRASTSLQDSPVGALNQFQAIQQQKTQHVLDITTWATCFTLHIAVMVTARAETISNMVAHLHTSIGESPPVDSLVGIRCAVPHGGSSFRRQDMERRGLLALYILPS